MTLSRRGFLRATYATSGIVTLATLGQTVTPLRHVSLLAPRRPDIGPQGFPVNRTAKDAGVLEQLAGGYALTVLGPRPVTLTLTELQAMPQHQVRLPIACVEGWSAMRTWSGVRLRDLLDLVGVSRDSHVMVDSMEKSGNYRASRLDPHQARHNLTLLALRVNGEVLDPDHGYPLRLIAADRPGVLQTKWVRMVGPA